MANATAPLKKAEKTADEKRKELENSFLNQEFDPEKKYMFELAEENPQRELPVMEGTPRRMAPNHKKFRPYNNIVLTSQIVWGGQRRNIRYYDGCTSIFVDEQPKEKETVDQFIKQTKPRHFLDGKFGAYGDERMLLLFMNICSWNTDSPFRTKSASMVFKSSNPDKLATQENERIDAIEEALKLAREASETKMKIHAAYLGISDIDWESGNEKDVKHIRSEYRKKAAADPVDFIESYGNEKLEIKYYIDKAIETGLINNKANPNELAWASSGTKIMNISGLKSPAAWAEKLFELSQLEEGEEFAIQLKALNN